MRERYRNVLEANFSSNIKTAQNYSKLAKTVLTTITNSFGKELETHIMEQMIL